MIKNRRSGGMKGPFDKSGEGVLSCEHQQILGFHEKRRLYRVCRSSRSFQSPSADRLQPHSSLQLLPRQLLCVFVPPSRPCPPECSPHLPSPVSPRYLKFASILSHLALPLNHSVRCPSVTWVLLEAVMVLVSQLTQHCRPQPSCFLLPKLPTSMDQ